MKSLHLLLAIWLSSIVTFGSTTIYLVSRANSINTADELNEVLSALGIILFAALLMITVATVFLRRK